MKEKKRNALFYEYRVAQTMMKKTYLCGSGHCPAVEAKNDQILIGEDGNLAVLTKAQWNFLVEKIQTGELGKA